MAIDRLTFVYDADGTLVGELRYVVGTLFGGEHCSLCDITHGRLRKRPDFLACATRIGLPIEYLHRNDLSGELADIARDHLPCVIAHDGDRVSLLLGGEALRPLHGDVAAFEALVADALAAADEAR